MPIKLEFTMVKYNQSRNPKMNYSCKEITKRLDSIGWDHEIRAPATMILVFWTTFETKQDALQGRKDLDFAMAPYHWYRLDSVTEI